MNQVLQARFIELFGEGKKKMEGRFEVYFLCLAFVRSFVLSSMLASFADWCTAVYPFRATALSVKHGQTSTAWERWLRAEFLPGAGDP